MTDATINVSGHSVPLIGVPADAVLEECDLCHDTIPMREAVVTGTGVLCKKCADLDRLSAKIECGERLTNQERLKRQGIIFNHNGKCGKIIT